MKNEAFLTYSLGLELKTSNLGMRFENSMINRINITY